MRTPRPPRSFWFAHVVRGTIGKLFTAAFRTSLRDWDRVPDSGVIIAGNHLSYADPALLWCKSPRPIHFMARDSLWANTVLGWALDHFWAFPVSRGSADREALQKAGGYLKSGEPVGIFPEGTRKFKRGDEDAHGGAAFLALRNEVPIVPVGIAGTDRIKPPGARLIRFPKVVMCFGDPIDPATFTEGGRKERVEAITAETMRRIAEQVERAERIAKP